MNILNTRKKITTNKNAILKKIISQKWNRELGAWLKTPAAQDEGMHSRPSDSRLPAWESSAAREETEIVETDVLATGLQIQGENLSQESRKKWQSRQPYSSLGICTCPEPHTVQTYIPHMYTNKRISKER